MPARRLLAVELIPTALLAAAVACGVWGFSYDDSWITYRYADNWAQGRGFAFNPGEAVLGTTAPGWALALGALSRASSAVGLSAIGVPEWGTLLTVAALWWLAAALPALWLPAESRLRPALPLVLGTLALSCRWNLELLGAEAFPAAALAATAAWLALGGEASPVGGASPGREVLAGLTVAGAMLCRLDAGLAAAAIGIALWVVRRRFPWRFAIAGLAPLVLYLAWLKVEFGSILPNTLTAKRGEAAVATRGFGEWQWVWLGRSFGAAGRSWLLALAVAGGVLAAWTAIAGRRGQPLRADAENDSKAAWRRHLATGGEPRPGASHGPATAAPAPEPHAAGSAGPVRSTLVALAALAAWLVVHEIFYRLTGVVFAPWYWIATVTGILALAAFAAVSVGERLATLLAARLPAAEADAGAPPPGARPLTTALALLLALPILLPGARFLAATWGEPPDVRTRLYSAVGRYFHRHAAPDARVASMEIGALAYTADRPVLDLVGLVDPAVVEARRAGRLPEHVAAVAPEYLLVPPPFLGRELGDVMRHPEIRARYAPVARFYDAEYEHDPVTLFQRRGEPADRRPGPR